MAKTEKQVTIKLTTEDLGDSFSNKIDIENPDFGLCELYGLLKCALRIIKKDINQ